MIWFIGNPDFSIPGNVRRKLPKCVSIKEGCDKDQWLIAAATQLLQSHQTFRRDRTKAMHRFNQEQPSAFFIP